MNLVKSQKTGKAKASITGRVEIKNEDVSLETLNQLRAYAKNQLLETIGMQKG